MTTRIVIAANTASIETFNMYRLPLFGVFTLRLLARDGGLRNSRTAPFLVCVIDAVRLCHR